jgi:alpha-1,2-mannosyltransferase
LVWLATFEAYVRGRTRLWSAAGLWAGVLLIGFDVYAAVVTYIPEYRVRNDFRLIYGAALTGLHYGYGHLYDLAAQKASVEGLGPGFYWSPFLNPPPLAWLATPLTILPFDAAVWVWTLLVFGALLLTWFLVAPGDTRLTKYAYLALWLGVFPTAFGVLVGQPVALVAAAVAFCWWLSERNRTVWAGIALAAIAVKPQVAILVPLCLLVSGHTRTLVTWLAATAVLAVLALAMLGQDGVARYRDALALASQWEPTRRYAVSGLIGLGPQLYVLQAAIVALTVAAAWRIRTTGPGLPIAAGILGSLLFTPYVGFQDFAMLFVAGWLMLRSRATEWQVGILLVGFVLLELVLVLPPVLVLVTELSLLVSLLLPLNDPPRVVEERAPAQEGWSR